MQKWIDIIGYEGLYKLNEFGEVFSVKYNRKLSLRKTQKGYYTFLLHKDSAGKNIPAHRLVAKHFIPNPSNKPFVNHIDCNKTNNHISNLEWCTAKENTNHAWVNGIGTTLKARELNKKPVININNGVFYDSINDAYEHTNISKTQFLRMLSNKIKNTTPFYLA